jgi:hypothetical protein
MNNTEIKARALVLKFMQPIDKLHKYPMCFDTAKQCALIAVDEIIKESRDDEYAEYYWIKFKQEIEKL